MRSRRLAIDSDPWLYHAIFGATQLGGDVPTSDHGSGDYILLTVYGGGDDSAYPNGSPIAPEYLTIWTAGLVSTDAPTQLQQMFMGLDPLNADFSAFPGSHYDLGRFDPAAVDITVGSIYRLPNGRPSPSFVVEFTTVEDPFSVLASFNIDNGFTTTSPASLQRLAEGQQVFGTPLSDDLFASPEAQTHGLEGNDTITGLAAQIDMFGDDGNDTLNDPFGGCNLYGGRGNDTINAGQRDYVSGGEGDDLILPFIEADDNQTTTGFARMVGYYDGGAGKDRVLIDLSPDPRNLVLTVSDAYDSNVGSYFTVGDSLALINVEGVELRGGIGGDTFKGGAGNDVLRGNGGNDVLNGSGGDDALLGSSGADTMTGGDGDDYLDGGAGTVPAGQHDVMSGGLGNDIFVIDAASDEVIEEPGPAGGTDTVRTFISYTLLADFENIQLMGTGLINCTGNDAANKLTGNDAANTLTGLGGADILDGGKGADTMVGGAGDDTYYVDDVGDKAVEVANQGIDLVISSVSFSFDTSLVNNLRLVGAAAINGTGNNFDNEITGNDAANTLTGLDGNDTLNGGKGADTLVGGKGNDTYYIDNLGDKIIELGGEGTDTVYSTVSFTFGPAAVNILRLSGTGAINGTGNDGNGEIYGNDAANTLTGLGGNDRLDGGKGADTMIGGTGDDTFYVDNALDKVTELTGQGTDTVFARVSYSLVGTAVEVLRLAGTDPINATGNELANTLVGNSAANVLDGLTGADLMVGGAGDDTYTVDNAADRVAEKTGGGNDTINASVSFTLTETFVETLRLTGGAAINATGNGQGNTLLGNGAANVLTGLGGADTLDGGAGADTLVGGTGDDTYTVDNSADIVTENAGEGNDTVLSSVTYTLAGTAVETLRLMGSSAINATGNDNANTLVGNDGVNTLTGLGGNDVLDGGKGADTMAGGAGDDTYFVDISSDKATEANGEGNDTVFSSVTFGLGGTFVETLVLTGSAAINGSGNSQANTLIGNDGANILSGFGGADTLDGGLGADTLTGGDGADVFRFSVDPLAAASDTITDFATGTDKIALVSAVFNEMAPGALSASAFVTGTAAADGDDRIIYDATTGKLWFDADGNFDDPAVLLATLAPSLALSAADFVVI